MSRVIRESGYQVIRTSGYQGSIWCPDILVPWSPYFMIILGVDPGLRTTGYGVIDSAGGRLRLVEAGVVNTNARDGIARRLSTIYRGIGSLCEDHRPAVIVVEKLFAHHAHPASAILMGHARAAVCLASAEHEIPLVSVASTRVKKSVISHGHASKEQIQRAVQRYLGLKKPPQPNDVADALAIAISHALTHSQIMVEAL